MKGSTYQSLTLKEKELCERFLQHWAKFSDDRAATDYTIITLAFVPEERLTSVIRILVAMGCSCDTCKGARHIIEKLERKPRKEKAKEPT